MSRDEPFGVGEDRLACPECETHNALDRLRCWNCMVALSSKDRIPYEHGWVSGIPQRSSRDAEN